MKSASNRGTSSATGCEVMSPTCNLPVFGPWVHYSPDSTRYAVFSHEVYGGPPPRNLSGWIFTSSKAALDARSSYPGGVDVGLLPDLAMYERFTADMRADRRHFLAERTEDIAVTRSIGEGLVQRLFGQVEDRPFFVDVITALPPSIWPGNQVLVDPAKPPAIGTTVLIEDRLVVWRGEATRIDGVAVQRIEQCSRTYSRWDTSRAR